MKTHNITLRLLAMLLVSVILIGSVPMSAGAAASTERTYKEKEVTAYLLSMEKSKPIKCLFYDDMPSVPYIGVMDYLSTVYGDEFKFSDEGSGIYTVKSSAGKSMIIDTATDKIHFDEFENFLPNSESDIDESNDAGFIKNMKTTFEGTADYSKLYDIDAAAKFLDDDYAKVTPVKVQPSSVKTSGMPITTILLIVIPVVILIAAIVILLIARKRKKASSK